MDLLETHTVLPSWLWLFSEPFVSSNTSTKDNTGRSKEVYRCHTYTRTDLAVQVCTRDDEQEEVDDTQDNPCCQRPNREAAPDHVPEDVDVDDEVVDADHQEPACANVHQVFKLSGNYFGMFELCHKIGK